MNGNGLAHLLAKIDALAGRMGARFPSPHSVGLRYSPAANEEWTPGFWTGMLWLAYQHTGDAGYRRAAEALLPSFAARLERGGPGVETHDLGFLYALSCLAGHRLTGDPALCGLASRAASLLLERYLEKPGVLQAWGGLDDPEQAGRVIIDSVMNVPLLFWKAERGDARAGEAARSHLDQVARHLVRSDGSTIQTFFFDARTGAGRFARTHQGVSDDSCWARGQAWAIYGYALAHRYAREPRYLEASVATAEYFLRRLPSDGVCYWDLVFDEGAPEPKDTSAAAVAAAGLLELGERLASEPARAERYRDAAGRLLAALAAHTSADPAHDGILLHGVYNRPRGQGVDESCLWGDYFYAEALMRRHGRWSSFW